MASVTKRIETIKQPQGGYVPKSLFAIEEYLDENEITEVESAFTAIQGLAVDYMTRFMLSKNKEESFLIAIMGAARVDEAFENNKEKTHIKALLDKVKGLDDESIIAACQISGYDTAFRAGVKTFKDVDSIQPTKDVIENIHIMVERTMLFLKKHGPVTKFGFTFEGGYTSIVSSGDGDYLTKDMLIDLKVSKQEFTSKWSLQILMYYLLGINSIHPEFNSLKSLCIYNPLKNLCYIVDLSDISDESKYVVSSHVIGYKMKKSYYVPLRERQGTDKPEYDYSSWRETDGENPIAYRRFLQENSTSDFDINSYKDGIYDISVDDYWTFLKKNDPDYRFKLRPQFDRTQSVVMIKKNGYKMFLSKSGSGNLSVLDGGHLKRTKHTPEYYYNNLENYGIAVINKFSKYWEALHSISDQLKTLTPSPDYLKKNHYSEYVARCKAHGWPKEKFKDWYEREGKKIRLEGKVHGCIVDLDFLDHVYLNPYNGKIIAYSARSMYDKDVYQNVKSLIAERRPEMLESLLSLEQKDNTSLLVSETGKATSIIVNKTDEINKKVLKEYSTDMYEMSRLLKQLQKVYDMQLITVWHDEFLGENIILIEDKQEKKKNKRLPHKSEYSYSIDGIKSKTKKFLGEEKKQKCGMTAKLIEHNNYADVSVEFEDGTIVEHIPFEQWKKGYVEYPKAKDTIKSKKK